MKQPSAFIPVAMSLAALAAIGVHVALHDYRCYVGPERAAENRDGPPQ